ncbi:MAG: hypothetical protein PF486_02490 [Prolixibacteraceae bacterium]|jgi:hypothetical protein|nr:hypothetical protein [Prolixibacteraceae bacterium]
MNLIKVLSKVNQIEKISFLKILDKYSEDNREKNPKIDKILSDSDNVLKKAEDSNIVQLFNLLRDEYTGHLKNGIRFSNFQIELVVEIFIRDGNQIMSRDWFDRLYKKSLKNLNSQIKSIRTQIGNDKADISSERKRDYIIFKNCVDTAYNNDIEHNREQRLSWEEKTILHTLSKSLDLSREEQKAITYSIIPPEKFNVDDVINELKETGIVFFNRKSNTIFVPDEIIYLLRKILEIELPFKYLRRILKHLKDPEINLISKRHGIDRKFSRFDKIKAILHQGVNVTSLISNEIFQDKVNKGDRAKRIQELITKDLDISVPKLGRSLEERIYILLDYFRNQEKEDSTSLSKDGLTKLVALLVEFKPDLNKMVKAEFELQEDEVMTADLLSDYGIGPRDLLYLLSKIELVEFSKQNKINSRGNNVLNIINSFRNIQDLYLDNYVEIGCRDINSLKDKGLVVKESELGSLYEKLTKDLFKRLGFHVDEKLRSTVNNARSKMDVLINLGSKDVIIAECKTFKDKDYNKFTAVSRQLKSYEALCKKNGYHVNQAIVVSNDFTEDFIGECEYEYDISISLLTSNDLLKIYQGLKESHLEELPVRLITRGGALNGDRIVKALSR